jgi:hypothetical protein
MSASGAKAHIAQLGAPIEVLPQRHNGQNTSPVRKSRVMSSRSRKNIHLSEIANL